MADNTHAMQSLLSAYADNDGDDDAIIAEDVHAIEQHPGANFISDDEDLPSGKFNFQSERDKSALSRLHNDEQKPHSANSSPIVKRMKLSNNESTQSATRLVSYLDDDQDEDSDASESEASDSEQSAPTIFGNSVQENVIVRNGSALVLNQAQAEAASQEASRTPNSTTDLDIQLPSEATGKCSKRLQEKVEKLFEKMQRMGRDLNYDIQRRKDFRNPSIYEKIIEFCGIDEKGTNYPPELFHPDNWVLDENSFYDKLAQAQADLMSKKEKEAKKSKVERQIGIKKSASDASSVGQKHP